MEDLKTRMMEQLTLEQDPRALGQAHIFDTYKYVGSRAKGYETWLKKQELLLQEEFSESLTQPANKKAKR